MAHHAFQAFDHGTRVVASRLGPQIRSADFGIHCRDSASIQVVRRCAGKFVLVDERRAECAREREVPRFEVLGRAGVVVDARLQTPAAAARMEVDERIDVVEHVFGNRRGDHLRRVAARVARIDLVQIGAAVLLRRETPEPRGRHRVRNRDHDEAASELCGSESAEKFPDRDGREKFVAVRVSDDSKCRSRVRTGDNVQRHTQCRAIQHRRDVDTCEKPAFLLFGPQWCAQSLLLSNRNTSDGASPRSRGLRMRSAMARA